MGNALKSLSLTAFASLAVVSTSFATVITPTYTADQATFPGTPSINTTGTGSAAVNTNFTTAVPTYSNGVIDQTFVTGATAGTLGQIAFYTNGTGGTGGTGTSVAIRLYQLGTVGTPASAGFQGGGEADTYVFPNASVALGTAGTNADLLSAYAPTFEVTGSASNRYITVDLSGALLALAPNTTYAIELSNSTANTFSVYRGGATAFYGSGNIYGGANTGNSNVTAYRGLPNSGGVRDGAFAVYYAVSAPEPASLGVLGLGALATIRRRRA